MSPRPGVGGSGGRNAPPQVTCDKCSEQHAACVAHACEECKHCGAYAVHMDDHLQQCARVVVPCIDCDHKCPRGEMAAHATDPAHIDILRKKLDDYRSAMCERVAQCGPIRHYDAVTMKFPVPHALFEYAEQQYMDRDQKWAVKLWKEEHDQVQIRVKLRSALDCETTFLVEDLADATDGFSFPIRSNQHFHTDPLDVDNFPSSFILVTLCRIQPGDSDSEESNSGEETDGEESDVNI